MRRDWEGSMGEQEISKRKNKEYEREIDRWIDSFKEKTVKPGHWEKDKIVVEKKNKGGHLSCWKA